MTAPLVGFDLDPDVNWPTPKEFEVIRTLQDEGVIRETCPSHLTWHFTVMDPAVEERLPEVCLRLAHRRET